jgi:anti-sigma factor RsiW
MPAFEPASETERPPGGNNFSGTPVWNPAAPRIHVWREPREMSGEREDCLTTQEILAYLDGEMPEREKSGADRHLDDCRLCTGAVEGVAAMERRSVFPDSADRVLARLRERTARTAAPRVLRLPARRWIAPRYLPLAAMLLVGVGTAAYFSRPSAGEALFLRHFEPYPSIQPAVRGTATATSLSAALAQYERRDYRAALPALQEEVARKPEDATARFYAGMCRLALGQSRQAIDDLERVARAAGDDLQTPAEWYLALARLRAGDPAGARKDLAQIAEGRGFYRDQARGLLAEVERLDGAR